LLGPVPFPHKRESSMCAYPLVEEAGGAATVRERLAE